MIEDRQALERFIELSVGNFGYSINMEAMRRTTRSFELEELRDIPAKDEAYMLPVLVNILVDVHRTRVAVKDEQGEISESDITESLIVWRSKLAVATSLGYFSKSVYTLVDNLCWCEP